VTWRRGPVGSGPFFWLGTGLSRVPIQVQLLMVRFVDSQWLDDVTLLSPLVNVTSHDTAVLVLT
jgi:hypothetical protein